MAPSGSKVDLPWMPDSRTGRPGFDIRSPESSRPSSHEYKT